MNGKNKSFPFVIITYVSILRFGVFWLYGKDKEKKALYVSTEKDFAKTEDIFEEAMSQKVLDDS